MLYFTDCIEIFPEAQVESPEELLSRLEDLLELGEITLEELELFWRDLCG